MMAIRDDSGEDYGLAHGAGQEEQAGTPNFSCNVLTKKS